MIFVLSFTFFEMGFKFNILFFLKKYPIFKNKKLIYIYEKFFQIIILNFLYKY